MNVGKVWGYRDKPYTKGEPFSPVEVLQLGPTRSRKVHVRFLDGEYRGLDMWVSSSQQTSRTKIHSEDFCGANGQRAE